MNYGANPEDWINFDLLLSLTPDLLPVVSNPAAPISPKSTLQALGKTPSRYNKARQVVGITNWTTRLSSQGDIAYWSKEPDYGICLQTRNVRALDIDIPDAGLCSQIVEFISGELHWLGLPCRFRADSAKCLLAFRLPGDYQKRTMKVEGGIIEFLASGQQFVAIGTHPSGAKYQWEWQGHADFPTLSAEEFEHLWQVLTDTFALEPPTGESPRRTLNGHAPPNFREDDVSIYLDAHNHALGRGKEGQVFLRCPFSHEHTDTLEPGTATAYFPAGGRGYDQGHFKCLHAHCAGRDDAEFLDGIGYRLAQFKVISPDPAESASSDPISKIWSNIEKRGPREEFPIFSLAEFMNRPNPKWIIEKVLPRGELAIIFGASGAGKSFVALDMAFAVARGALWNDKKVEHGRVIYIAAEGTAGLPVRLRAYAAQHNVDLNTVSLQIIEAPFNLLNKQDAIDISKAILSQGKADVIFVDTLAQTTHGADENSGVDMGKVLGNCEGIHRATGALVVLIHHAGKDLSKGARGWSGMRAAADTELELTKLENGSILKITKQKDGDEELSWGIKLVPIVVGHRDDGDEVKSCFVEYTGAPGKASKRQSLGFWKQLALDAYSDMGEGAVSVSDLIDEMVNRSPKDNSQRDTRRQKCLRALKELSQLDMIKIENNKVIIQYN